MTGRTTLVIAFALVAMVEIVNAAAMPCWAMRLKEEHDQIRHSVSESELRGTSPQPWSHHERTCALPKFQRSKSVFLDDVKAPDEPVAEAELSQHSFVPLSPNTLRYETRGCATSSAGLIRSHYISTNHVVT